jgi:hypothetical protein
MRFPFLLADSMLTPRGRQSHPPERQPTCEGTGTDSERLDSQSLLGETGSRRQILPIDTTTGEQDHRLTDATQQVNLNQSTQEPRPHPDTTLHANAIIANYSQTTDDQLSTSGSTSGGCGKDMDQQTQPNPSATSVELTSPPQGPADSNPKHGTDTSRPELARPSPTDVGLLDGTSKPTDPLDFFPPGSPTELATESSSPVDPVDSSQRTARGATNQDMSAVRKRSQPVQPQSPYRPDAISSSEPSTAATPPSKGKLERFDSDHRSLLTFVFIDPPSARKTQACSSPSKASPLGNHNNKMDYVNRLPRGQRDQYAPLSNQRRQPYVTAQPPRGQQHGHEQSGGIGRKRKADARFPTSDKHGKRHRSSVNPTVSLSSAGGISAPSSRDHARGNTPAVQGDEGSPPVDAEQNRYAVEHLRNRRIRRLHGWNRQVTQYLVRWEGYGPKDDE